MKKLLVLAICMAMIVSSLPMGNIHAETNETAPFEDMTVVKGTLDLSLPLDIPMYAKDSKAMNLQVSITSQQEEFDLRLGDENVTDGKLSLQVGGEITYQIEVQKDGDKINNYHIRLNDLPTGAYTVKLKGAGYTSISQKVEIVDYSKHVTFANDQDFLIGDVNDDGQVNDKDYIAVLDAIDTKDEQTIAKYDLNRDGKVDIEDLHSLAQNTGVLLAQGSEDITNPIIDPSTIQTSVADDVKADNITNLFTDAPEVATVGFKDENVKISKDNPVELNLVLDEAKFMNKVEITPPASDQGVRDGTLIIEDVNGQITEKPFVDLSVFTRSARSVIAPIEIDLGKQIAVKKITIKVTGTKKETNLAEIAKVEFINDVIKDTPEKEVAYPKNVKAVAGDGNISLSWDHVRNIEGYQVKYACINPNTNKKEEKVVSTNEEKLTLSELVNFVDYTISVQSVASDNWQSGYGPSLTVTPKPKEKPGAPENISAAGKYKGFRVSWLKTKNATSYTVYYRMKGTSEYTKVSNLTTPSYEAMDLANGEYEIYATASNAFGESGNSDIAVAKTKDLEPVTVPNYYLINRSNGVSIPSQHVVDVTYPSLNKNDYDYPFNKFDVVDNDPTTYWNINSWDAGGFNDQKLSPEVEFDKAYTIKEMAVVPYYNQAYDFTYARVQYWDENGKGISVKASISKKTDTNGNTYYVVALPNPVKTKKIQVNVGLYLAISGAKIKISELKFYEYNSIEDDINGVYDDSMHLTLRKDVSKTTLDELSARLEQKDPVSNENHPHYTSLKQELAYAYDILDAQDHADLFTVDQSVNSGNDSYLGFPYSLSDLQPLGIGVRAKDELTVYVGADQNAQYGLQLVFTQASGTPYQWQKAVPLNKGKNTITVPDIISTTDEEHGGSVYVRYTKKAPSSTDQKKEIKLRVLGGTKIPYLNLAKKSEDEQKTAINNYLSELHTYNNTTLPKLYEGSTLEDSKKALNITEIMTDKGLLSLPVDTVYKALVAKGDMQAQANTLYDSGQALEQLIRMDYTSKGLSDDASEAINRTPNTRINIRWATPTDGAFMYAGGQHIGIPYATTKAMVLGKPNVKQSDGSYANGNLFGWGIAHELGHETDTSKMVYGETSNNLMSLFAQTYDGKTTSRIGSDSKEKDIYAKVTSGASGLSGNVFTQLGMFWQLHLYYDQNVITPDNISPYYAKLYTLYRENTEKVSTQEQKDNLLIRLASEAAGKDLSEYFTKWGFVPNATTKQYMEDHNLPKEDKDIFYINETARKNRLAGMTQMAPDTSVVASVVQDKDTHANDYRSVTLNLDTNKDRDKILGYEIKRNGTVVGFTTDTTFTDNLGSINNRVFTYEVTAYDYLLNKTATLSLDPIKVKHDGSINKNEWTMTSNDDKDKVIEGEEQDNNNLKALYNGNYTDVYTGTSTASNKYEILIDLNKQQSVSGFKFTAGLKDGELAPNTPKNYEIYISNDKAAWTKAASGNLAFSKDKLSSIVYFAADGNVDEGQLGIYDAHYVKVVFNTKTVALAEVDVIAPPGDNVDLLENGIGILKEDYTYAKGEVIPKGSLVFNGKYRGNPTFNAVLLFDENDINVADEEGSANSILLAQIPSKGNLYEVSDGNWIYWIEPGKYDKDKLPKQVKAELYRVDDATTLEGQRLVSDTLYVDVPKDLPEIILKNGQGE